MPDRKSFENELDRRFQALRGVLAESLGAVEIGDGSATEISRRLGVDKNLGWKLSKIVHAPDCWSAATLLPGDGGVKILLGAFKRAGASNDGLARLREATESFRRVIEEHVGDRATLELVLDGMRDTDRFDTSRKLAFRGTSGIWGVQARARMNLTMVAPNRENPQLIDASLVAGWLDFRRLRTDARWVLFRERAYSDAATPPLEEHPSLMREFCSSRLPEIRIEQTENARIYELAEGPIGNEGAFTYYSCWRTRGLGSRYRTPEDDHGEFAAQISAPVETLVFDMLVHRDLPYAEQAEVNVFGVLSSDSLYRQDRYRLPFTEQLQSIGAPPVMATTHAPRYHEVVNQLCRDCDWDLRDFRGLRFVLAYPPFPSTVAITFPLPDQPAQ